MLKNPNSYSLHVTVRKHNSILCTSASSSYLDSLLLQLSYVYLYNRHRKAVNHNHAHVCVLIHKRSQCILAQMFLMTHGCATSDQTKTTV